MERTDTLGQLRRLPELAAEVWLTRRHPNPVERPLVGGRRADPPAPARLDVIDALRLDEHGQLFALSQAVRAVCDETKTAQAECDTWSGVCGWLISQADVWRADPWLAEFVAGQVWDVWRALTRVAREPDSPSIPCAVEGCHGRITALDDGTGGWLWPDVCTDGHRVDRAELVRRWKATQPAPLADVAQTVGRSPRTLARWVAAGWLKPAAQDGRTPLYRADEAQRVAGLMERTS